MADEVILEVDADNRPVGPVPRSAMRRRNCWHRATYIFIENDIKEFYVQVRTTTKDYCPGYFDSATGKNRRSQSGRKGSQIKCPKTCLFLWMCLFLGGVVAYGEETPLSALRELEEEMGIHNVPITHLFDAPYDDDVTKVSRTCISVVCSQVPTFSLRIIVQVWGSVFHCRYNGSVIPQVRNGVVWRVNCVTFQFKSLPVWYRWCCCLCP